LPHHIQVEKLQTNSLTKNIKRQKNILRVTGFVIAANLETRLMTVFAENALKTLSMPPGRLVSNPRSLNPKKKKLSLTKFNSNLAQIIAPGHASSATLKVSF
jgi:hypothetical protein